MWALVCSAPLLDAWDAHTFCTTTHTDVVRDTGRRADDRLVLYGPSGEWTLVCGHCQQQSPDFCLYRERPQTWLQRVCHMCSLFTLVTEWRADWYCNSLTAAWTSNRNSGRVSVRKWPEELQAQNNLTLTDLETEGYKATPRMFRTWDNHYCCLQGTVGLGPNFTF